MIDLVGGNCSCITLLTIDRWMPVFLAKPLCPPAYLGAIGDDVDLIIEIEAKKKSR
jgi:hypothetical protein